MTIAHAIITAAFIGIGIFAARSIIIDALLILCPDDDDAPSAKTTRPAVTHRQQGAGK